MSAFIWRIRALGNWLFEARHFGLALVAILASVAWILGHPTEPTIRLAGLALQLLGIGTVIWGISETRRLFGHPPVFNKAKSWLRRFPLNRRDAVVPGDALSVSVSLLGGRMHSVHTPPEGATVEQRVTTLELNIGAINERIANAEADMDRETRKAETQLTLERRAREAEDAAIREKLEATGTGGVHISAIGASWLFVGVILSTASPELAAWLR